MPLQTSSLTGKQFGTPSLTSGPTQAGAGTYGKVPTVPDPSATQGQAITGNMGNLGNLYGLTGSLNTEIAGQAALPYQLNLPNYQQNIGQAAQNTTSLLQGQIPTDVANQLTQSAAERGISTGALGSPNSNAALMRALGTTSLGLQQQGAQNLSQQIAQTPTGQQFNPTSFLTTPQEQQQMQYLANLLGAAPTPGAGDRLNLNTLQQGLGGIGGPGGVRGGGASQPGADFFGNVYNPGEANTGVFGGGALGWPGGAQSGQPTQQAYNNWNQWASGLQPGPSFEDMFFDPNAGGTGGSTYMGPNEDLQDTFFNG